MNLEPFDAASQSSKLGSEPRQTEILRLLGQRGFVSIERLAKAFGVSEQTVRRDIKQLERRGMVTRYHGGAGLPHGPASPDYEKRRSRFADEKQRIATAVARHIPDGSTLFVDIGTTMEAVAEALLGHKNLTVLTNHLSVATILSRNADFQIIIAGGVLRQKDHSITGEATRDFLGRFRVGFGIFGIGGIDPDGELLDYDYRDVDVSKAAVRISRRKFVALDHSKFETDAAVRVAHVSDIDAVFTDAPPPQAMMSLLTRHGVALHIADAD